MEYCRSDESSCLKGRLYKTSIQAYHRTVWSAVWVLMLAVSCNLPATAQGPAEFEDQALRAMFTQGLTEPALNYVRARAKLEGRGPALAWWVMREMECHARWAQQDVANADQHWADCEAAVQNYQTTQLGGEPPEKDSRWPWIQWQMARCRLLKAQSLLAVYLAAPTNTSVRDQALELVRELLQRTDDLSKDIKRRQPLAARQSLNNNTEAPADQLRNLDADSQLLQCEALMIRWQLYPNGSEDRAAALADVRTTAAEFLRSRKDGAGRASLQYAEAIAELESGDKAALSKLEQLSLRSESLQIRMLAASALARELASAGQESRARITLDLLEQIAALDSSLAPQLVLSRIEIALARLAASKRPGNESELTELVKQAEQLGASYGDYWRTRAEALLVGKLSSSSVSNSKLAMDLLLAEVRQLTAKGDEDSMRAAAQKLLLGRDAQAAQGNGAAAILLTKQAATLFRELKEWDLAINAVQQTSIQFAADPSAADAHQWAIESQVVRLEKEITNVSQRDLYVRLLQQQLQMWPEAAASQTARQMLRRWCLGLKQRRLYVESILQMLPSCKDSSIGQSLVLECCEQTLQLNPADQAKIFEKWMPADGSSKKFPLAAVSKQAGLATVILADVTTREFPRGGSTRQQNWTEFDENAKSFDAGFISGFLNCAADVGRVQLQLPNNQPSKSWNDLEDSTRAVFVVALVDALDSLELQPRKTCFSSLNLDKNWAGFDKAGLSPTMIAAAERIAHWLGDSTAGERLKKLAERESRDGNVQLLYAHWLAEQNDWAGAKKVATQLAGLSAAGSPLQLSARWSLMRFQVASGEQAGAARAAKLLIASQPNLDPLWLARFTSISQL